MLELEKSRVPKCVQTTAMPSWKRNHFCKLYPFRWLSMVAYTPLLGFLFDFLVHICQFAVTWQRFLMVSYIISKVISIHESVASAHNVAGYRVYKVLKWYNVILLSFCVAVIHTNCHQNICFYQILDKIWFLNTQRKTSESTHRNNKTEDARVHSFPIRSTNNRFVYMESVCLFAQ